MNVQGQALRGRRKSPVKTRRVENSGRGIRLGDKAEKQESIC